MGYIITIGELVIKKYENDGLDCSCISFDAAPEKHDSAPVFGEPTDKTNQRWPSYGVWSSTLKDAGMYDLFFDNGHLIGGHPGVRLVTKDLYKEFSNRKRAFEELYKNVKATYGNPASLFEADESNPHENSVYCRIVWLDYWMKWALDNCKNPVIANS